MACFNVSYYSSILPTAFQYTGISVLFPYLYMPYRKPILVTEHIHTMLSDGMDESVHIVTLGILLNCLLKFIVPPEVFFEKLESVPPTEMVICPVNTDTSVIFSFSLKKGGDVYGIRGHPKMNTC